MTVIVRSFAKINLGLRIGAIRGDGFHELRTVYQTIGLHDLIGVEVKRGAGIEIRCENPRVPADESNTCYGVAAQVMAALSVRRRVIININKRLPVQGGLGGASGNAVAVMLALERALKRQLPETERFRIAAKVGSDLPLFLVGGTVLGVGRGEEVYPLPDLPPVACVLAMPEIGVSTPKAFADWDRMAGRNASGRRARASEAKLTAAGMSDKMLKFGYAISAWLSAFSQRQMKAGAVLSGVPAPGGGRAETPLLDLVRTGIENDFEQVVFPQYPELRQVKNSLLSAGAFYASLSGSGSATYGLFASPTAAAQAAARLRKQGTPAVVTRTLSRPQYWRKFLVSSF